MLNTEPKTVNPAGNPKIKAVGVPQRVPDETYKQEDFFRGPKKDESDPQWDRFKGFVKNIAAVPKEEVDELRAEHEREKKERRAR